MVECRKKNDLGLYVTPRKWNKLLIMCYERCCVCEGCEFADGFSEGCKCQAKASVLECVRLYGIPFERTKVVIDD